MNPLRLLALLAALSLPLYRQSPRATISVDAGRVINRVTPLMYGSCIEDVNHEIYGGLYAQMIFGESFEEPPVIPVPPPWRTYGGQWQFGAGRAAVDPDAGGKLVRGEPVLVDGTVECQVRIVEGDCAGLILRVQDPRIGADEWTGYEVSLGRAFLRVGRHRNNWRHFRDVPIAASGGWRRLKVQLTGARIRVSVDGAELFDYNDAEAPVLNGLVGLRTWNAQAEFRDLAIRPFTGVEVAGLPAEAPRPADEVSGMWDRIASEGSAARFGWDTDRPFNTAHSQRVEVHAAKGHAGVRNRGLNRWGLSVRAGHTYRGHLYLRQRGYGGAVTVALEDASGSTLFASRRIAGVGGKWRRFDFTLKPDATDANASFGIWIDQPGTVWIDQVYLEDRDNLFHGLPMRADIAQALQRQGLRVLRYGGSMVNAPTYRWKQMIGPRDLRPQVRGTWYPYSTNGFGIEDFVQFCRAAGFEPVFAMNIEETAQDAADLVEYLNGPVSSPWGRRRAENGHPAPYGVRYIEIGNEEETNGHYLERFKLLEPAMHGKDAGLQLIIAGWWDPNRYPMTAQILRELSGKAALWDVHVGGDGLRDGAEVDRTFTRMERLIGEWAPGSKLKACVLEENGGRHDQQRALGHAAILNATRRHGDFVLIDCPANCLQPWRQNDNGWDQGQLFLDSGRVWPMPPYWSQWMAATNHQPLRVESSTTGAGEDLDVTALRSEDGRTLVLSVVNLGAAARTAEVRFEGFGARASVRSWTLAAPLDAINSAEAPDRVLPHEAPAALVGAAFTRAFPAHSYTVLRLQQR